MGPGYQIGVVHNRFNGLLISNVNKVGIMITKQFMQQTDDEIQSTINVNLLGQIWVLREFLPAMVKLDRGSITFMCGLPGHAGAPNM